MHLFALAGVLNPMRVFLHQFQRFFLVFMDWFDCKIGVEHLVRVGIDCLGTPLMLPEKMDPADMVLDELPSTLGVENEWVLARQRGPAVRAHLVT